MSFKCDKCNVVSAERVSPKRVIVEQRPVTYTKLYDGEEIVIGQGTEPVREENWCPSCWMSGEETLC